VNRRGSKGKNRVLEIIADYAKERWNYTGMLHSLKEAPFAPPRVKWMKKKFKNVKFEESKE
jgi:hypothetical protein